MSIKKPSHRNGRGKRIHEKKLIVKPLANAVDAADLPDAHVSAIAFPAVLAVGIAFYGIDHAVTGHAVEE